MRKTAKWYIFPALLLLLLLPQTVLAASASAVSIISYTFDKKAVTVGESATMTIRTNEAANYVWVKGDGVIKSATYVSTNIGGLKEWTITITPSKTQAVFVYANTVNSTTGAVVRVRSIKATAAPVKIESLTIDKSTITEGEAVTMTIKTNDKVGYVWAFLDNQYVLAAHKSTDANGSKNWTLTVSPLVTQAITVSANTAYATSGMVSATQAVTVNKAVVTISSVTADETDIGKGESIEITIRTNVEANYVWVECDGKIKNARLESARTTSKTWYVSVAPSKDQKIIAYASWDANEANAVTKTLQVYVSEDYVRILSVEPSVINAATGETRTITVYTNYEANYVWTTINGSYVNFTNNYADSRYDEKRWIYTTSPLVQSETITIYAGRNNYNSNDASTTLRIALTSVPPSISLSTYTLTVQANGSASFDAYTNMAVEKDVVVRGLSAPSQYTVSRRTGSNNQYIWTITIYSIPGSPGDTMIPYHIDAYANDYSLPATGTIYFTLN